MISQQHNDNDDDDNDNHIHSNVEQVQAVVFQHRNDDDNVKKVSVCADSTL